VADRPGLAGQAGVEYVPVFYPAGFMEGIVRGNRGIDKSPKRAISARSVYNRIKKEARMTDRIDEFQSYRARMNERIFEIDHLGIKRFFNLDTMAYNEGALDAKTKELLGLVASMVLRCNDCIDYHVIQCIDAGVSDEELYETFNVALVVGGSIVIPHLRHAVESVDLYRQKKAG
jgi:AhpD family alkylhydroperoxidase